MSENINKYSELTDDQIRLAHADSGAKLRAEAERQGYTFNTAYAYRYQYRRLLDLPPLQAIPSKRRTLDYAHATTREQLDELVEKYGVTLSTARQFRNQARRKLGLPPLKTGRAWTDAEKDELVQLPTSRDAEIWGDENGRTASSCRSMWSQLRYRGWVPGVGIPDD